MYKSAHLPPTKTTNNNPPPQKIIANLYYHNYIMLSSNCNKFHSDFAKCCKIAVCNNDIFACFNCNKYKAVKYKQPVVRYIKISN